MKANEFNRRIEIRDRQGRVVVLFEELNEDGNGVAAASQTQPKPEESAQDGAPTNGSPPMTQAQRRYLFRILAGRGLQGDEAHAHLRELFGVGSLDVVSKREATHVIDQLLQEGNAEAGSHGTAQR
jgi:hypothetical protein